MSDLCYDSCVASLQTMRILWPSVPQKTQLAMMNSLTHHFQTANDPVSVNTMRSITRPAKHLPSRFPSTTPTSQALREAMITHFLTKHPILTVGERTILSRDASQLVVDTLTMLANLGSKWEQLPLSLQQIYADGMVRCLHSISAVRVKNLEDA